MKLNKLSDFIFTYLIIIILSSGVVSCNPDDETTPEKKSARATGWFGESDNASAVPENIINPFDDVSEDQLPKKVDLSQYLPPVGDQGQYGTCVAWAAGYNLKTAMEGIKFGLTTSQLQSPTFQMSPKYLFTALPSSEKGADCNGTAFTNALNLMLKKGVATKQLVPYTELGNCAETNNNPAWDEEAKKHKIKNYRRIDASVVAIKRALANKMPVVIGCKLDDNFMQWNSEAVYQFSGPTTDVGIHSYHALCIVGYDNDKGPLGAFKVVNSWSNQWGDAGFIWVDYNFMVNGFVFGDNGKNLYVAVNDEQKPDVTDPGVPVSGKNLTAWILKDYPKPTIQNPTMRMLQYNIYNQGSEPINADSKWGYAIIYVNATNAKDLGIVSYCEFDPTAPKRYFLSENPNPNIRGLKMNVDIPSNSNLAFEFQTDRSNPDQPGRGDYLEINYIMPPNLNGNYYTVFVVDINFDNQGKVTEKFQESDEEDNFFYFPEQEPRLYTNGVGNRKNTAGFAFNNPISVSKLNTSEAKAFHTPVNPSNRNAYSTSEIIAFLKQEKRNGGLDRRIFASRNITSNEKMIVRSNK